MQAGEWMISYRPGSGLTWPPRPANGFRGGQGSSPGVTVTPGVETVRCGYGLRLVRVWIWFRVLADPYLTK